MEITRDRLLIAAAAVLTLATIAVIVSLARDGGNIRSTAAQFASPSDANLEPDRAPATQADVGRKLAMDEQSARDARGEVENLARVASSIFAPQDGAPVEGQDESEHVLVGSVVAADGNPIAGVRVTAFSHEFGAFGRSSGVDGHLEIPVKDAGSYSVGILVPNEEHVFPSPRTIAVRGRTPFSIEAIEGIRSASGILRDSKTGAPLPDVLIEAFHQGDLRMSADGTTYFERGSRIGSTRTNEVGAFVLGSLPACRVGLLPGKGVFRQDDPHCPLGAPASTVSIDLTAADAEVELEAVAAEWVVLRVELADPAKPVHSVVARYERMESAPGIDDRPLPRSDNLDLTEEGFYELRIGPRLPLNGEVQVRVVIEEEASAIRDLTVVHGEVIHLRI